MNSFRKYNLIDLDGIEIEIDTIEIEINAIEIKIDAIEIEIQFWTKVKLIYFLNKE